MDISTRKSQAQAKGDCKGDEHCVGLGKAPEKGRREGGAEARDEDDDSERNPVGQPAEQQKAGNARSWRDVEMRQSAGLSGKEASHASHHS
jgi:hypothetical protein